MRIKCGNCGHSHESVDAVRQCYNDDVQMVSDANTRKTHYQDHADRGTITREQANRYDRNTMGGSSSGRMATEPMKRYAGNLAAEREMTAATSAEILTKVKAGSLTFDRARQFIDQYKNAPMKTARRQGKPSAVTEDGMYRNPGTGEIYKVQFNKAEGDGRRLYAKRLVLFFNGANATAPSEETAEQWDKDRDSVRFEYAGSPGRVGILPEWKMTADEAREFGALYGSCCNCGRTLTRESSIAHGYGPTCADNNGWPYDPKAVPA